MLREPKVPSKTKRGKKLDTSSLTVQKSAWDGLRDPSRLSAFRFDLAGQPARQGALLALATQGHSRILLTTSTPVRHLLHTKSCLGCVLVVWLQLMDSAVLHTLLLFLQSVATSHFLLLFNVHNKTTKQNLISVLTKSKEWLTQCEILWIVQPI